MAFQFSYDYRNGFDWNILSTEPSLFNPDIFDRYKASAIKVQTFLFDMVLKPTVEWGGFVPYIKGGIGIASNKINWVQNYDITTPFFPSRTFNTIIAGKTTTNFAWDAGVGANYFVNSQFTVGLGYRFVDIGALKTRNVYFDTVENLRDSISPLEAKHIFLNEVSVSAGYYFDYT